MKVALRVIEKSDDRHVDVYGRSESGRVLGLAPTVTLNGRTLRPIVNGFGEWEFPWLYQFDPCCEITGTLEVRWGLLAETVELP